MEELVLLLDQDVQYGGKEIVDDKIMIHISSRRTSATCPYCGKTSDKVHSRTKRMLSDLPIQGRKVKHILTLNKYFCKNSECDRKTFAERFSFFEPNATRTNRLQEEIMRVSLTQSSVSASKYLKASVTDIGKSTICTMLKKGREK